MWCLVLVTQHSSFRKHPRHLSSRKNQVRGHCVGRKGTVAKSRCIPAAGSRRIDTSSSPRVLALVQCPRRGELVPVRRELAPVLARELAPVRAGELAPLQAWKLALVQAQELARVRGPALEPALPRPQAPRWALPV